jgi:hypothetical protein
LEAGLFDIDNAQFVNLDNSSDLNKLRVNQAAIEVILSNVEKFKNSEPQPVSLVLANLTYLADEQTVAEPNNRQEVIFGEVIRMLGYDISPSTLTLYWQAEKELVENYVVFVHILNDKGELVAQADGEPFDGHYPTSLWPTDQVWRDARQLPQPTPGEYQFFVGWYRPQSGERLSAVDADGATWPDQAVPLGTITIE